MGLGEIMLSGKPQGAYKDDPQLRLVVIEERMPELAIYGKKIGDLPNSHQGYSIQ